METRECVTCLEVKPLGEFYRCGKGFRGQQRHMMRCKECHSGEVQEIKKRREALGLPNCLENMGYPRLARYNQARGKCESVEPVYAEA